MQRSGQEAYDSGIFLASIEISEGGMIPIEQMQYDLFSWDPTIGNGVGEGHHDNCEEGRNGISSSAPGDGSHIHHHEGPYHQQGGPHCIGGDASCSAQTHSQTK